MEENDEIISNNKKKNLNKVIIQTSLNNKTEYIQSYGDKKYNSNNNNTKYSLKHKKIIFETNFNKDNYPYYFKYNDSIDDDILKYKKQKNNSQIIYTSNNANNNNLNWYENFKKSKFYKDCSIGKISSDVKYEEKSEKNKESLLQNKMNEIANSFKVINDINNKYSFEPYLIKNKYAELF